MEIIERLQKFFKWFDKLTLIKEVAIIFTLITIINSWMMVQGWDQPKEGAFAYVHLLSRLAIITLIICIWEYKIIVEKLKGWFNRKSASNSINEDKHRNSSNSRLQLFIIALSVSFSAITVTSSLIMVIFQEVIRPSGGEALYQNLLWLFGILILPITVISLLKNKKSRKK